MIIRVSITAAAAAVLLAGCGSGSGGGSTASGSGSAGNSSGSTASAPSSGGSSAADNSALAPKALADAALKAVQDAKSFHVSAVGTSSGTALKIDMRYGADASKGTITIGSDPIRLIKADGKVYFTAPDSYWRKQAGAKADTVLPIVSGKWVLVPADKSSFAELASFADRDAFVAELSSGANGKTYESVPGGTIDGVQTVGVKDTGDGSILYVARTGTPYPVRSTSGDASGSGTVTFDEWDKPVTAAPPPAGDVVDLSRLK